MSSNEPRQFRLGLIGYGDVGHAIALGLHQAGLRDIVVYARRAFSGTPSGLIQQRARDSGVALLTSPAEVAARADVVLAVTQGSEVLGAADAIRPALEPRHLYVDLASTTPRVKQQMGELLRDTGARVAEGAIFTSAAKDGHRMQMAASGPAAEEFRSLVVPWGMDVSIASAELGAASAIKILRSVLTKGLEALLWESAIGATRYGIRDAYFASLRDWFDNEPFMSVANRLLCSGVVHDRRRSEEVQMSKEALEDVGIEPVMTASTVRRLRGFADYGLREKLGGVAPESYEEAIDLIDACLKSTP